MQKYKNKGLKKDSAGQLLTCPDCGCIYVGSTQMLVVYLSQLTEETSFGLLTVSCPVFNPKLLHVQDHCIKDGLPGGKVNVLIIYNTDCDW